MLHVLAGTLRSKGPVQNTLTRPVALVLVLIPYCSGTVILSDQAKRNFILFIKIEEYIEIKTFMGIGINPSDAQRFPPKPLGV